MFKRVQFRPESLGTYVLGFGKFVSRVRNTTPLPRHNCKTRSRLITLLRLQPTNVITPLINLDNVPENSHVIADSIIAYIEVGSQTAFLCYIIPFQLVLINYITLLSNIYKYIINNTNR